MPVKSRQPLLEIGRCVWRVSNGNRPEDEWLSPPIAKDDSTKASYLSL